MLSASELARRSGISRGHLHHVENRSFTPSLRTLEKISFGLGVGLRRLLTLNSSGSCLKTRLSSKSDHFCVTWILNNADCCFGRWRQLRRTGGRCEQRNDRATGGTGTPIGEGNVAGGEGQSQGVPGQSIWTAATGVD